MYVSRFLLIVAVGIDITCLYQTINYVEFILLSFVAGALFVCLITAAPTCACIIVLADMI